MPPHSQTIPAIILASALLVYCFFVVLMFRKNSNGVRRRWHTLDYVWVPLGGLTIVTLLAVLLYRH
ncbi:MAG TPA: hypothetical protein VGO67_01160 [Verrucomicrobiae bacterium]